MLRRRIRRKASAALEQAIGQVTDRPAVARPAKVLKNAAVS
jgi:hypothetical protein